MRVVLLFSTKTMVQKRGKQLFLRLFICAFQSKENLNRLKLGAFTTEFFAYLKYYGLATKHNIGVEFIISFLLIKLVNISIKCRMQKHYKM